MDEDTEVESRKRKADEVSNANDNDEVTNDEVTADKKDESLKEVSNEETKDNGDGDDGGEKQEADAPGEENKSSEAAQEDEKETPAPEEEEGGDDDGDGEEEDKVEATDPVEPAEKPKKDATSSNPYDSLKYIVITNDGKPENMIKLVALKSLFAKQLPKMPRAYIARLVFDRKHTSLAILSEDPAVKDTDEEVIGSICYRAFPEMRFAEIAFCAVNASHQVKVRTVSF